MRGGGKYPNKLIQNYLYRYSSLKEVALIFLLMKCGLCTETPKEHSMERGVTLVAKRLTDIYLARRQCQHQQ